MKRTLRSASLRAAFTLVELLVVIAIFVLLLAIAVPAFSSMIYSSEQSLADNHLRMGLAAARDAAIRSGQGTDAAAVFFYDPLTGHSTILPCVKAGMLKDSNPDPAAPQGSTVDREVFVPAPGFEPVQLPRSWNVRGYAAPNTIDLAWYGDQRANNLYRTQVAQRRGNWLFPETAFYDEDDVQNDDGMDRQTFMVRFEGGTGVVKSWDMSAVLVLATNPSTVARLTPPWSLYPALGQPFRVDLDPDPARFVRRVLSWPATAPNALSLVNRRALLGDISGDTVLAKPVGQLALCNEKKLSYALGARLDPATNCLYQDVTPMAAPQREPVFITINGAPFNDAKVLELNDWIEGHLALASPPPLPASQFVESDCRIYSIHRYLGTLQEITGTAGGQGVSQ